MCFTHLPIDFDNEGRAHLKSDAAHPFSYETRSLPDDAGRLNELLARNGHIKAVDFDPVTRIAGALAFHTIVDLHQRPVLQANSIATLFRGYEVLLVGRSPRLAASVSSRACGVCGGVHSAAAALALEIAPPPLGIVARNLLNALDHQHRPGRIRRTRVLRVLGRQPICHGLGRQSHQSESSVAP